MTDIIGLLGRDFCGSTIISRALNAVDGVVSIGEAFWLVDEPEGRGKCTRHHPCPQIDAVRYDKYLIDMNLYAKLAEQFEAERLVVSDKHVDPYYRRFIDLSQLHAVIVFKSPLAFAASDKHNLSKRPHFSSIKWRKDYPWLLRNLDAFKSWVVVDLDRFVDHPHRELIRICESSGMEKVEVALSPMLIDHCNVGGNGSAWATSRLYRDERWITELTLLEKMEVLQDSSIWEDYFRLIELSRQ